MQEKTTCETLMSRPRTPPPLPPCYALVQPGLEPVASEEIARDLGGEVKRTGRGLVVFRVPTIDDRLVAQMTGKHGYRRVDARKALAQGLAGKLPASWRAAEENAAVEVWLTIDGATAVCGLRLSDRTMRHRKYKREHLPASLRPTLAAAMVRLAGGPPAHLVAHPMCGA